jgi:CRP-like cAMP-binding protein
MSNQSHAIYGAAAGAGASKAVPALSPSESWNALYRFAPPQEYAAGAVLFQQGFMVRDIFLIDQGVVKLIRLAESGQEMIVGLRAPGCILGTASAIVQKPHSVTATTLSECCLRKIPLDVFLDLARNNQQFCWHLHQVHSREVYDQADQLVGIKYLSARQRLEQLLQQLILAMGVDELQKPIMVPLPLKHWEIAQMIGITPEHLSRVLKQLQQEGVMRRDNGCMMIYDLQQLYNPTSFS